MRTAYGRPFIARVLVVASLVVAYALAGTFLRIHLHTSAIHTHFVYIPVTIAGIWWGKRAIPVAALLALAILVQGALGLGDDAMWSDALRAVFIVSVGVCVGFLSDQAMADRAALAASERRHRQLIEKSLAGILVYAGDRVLFANATAARMLGRSTADLLGRSIWELVHREDHAKVRKLLDKRLAGVVTDIHYECRLAGPGGSVVWADMLSCPTDYEGRESILVNAYDITPRKEAEEKRAELAELARQQQDQLVHSTRLAELGEMAAAVSHEVNQPLTGIRNFARNAIYMLEQGAGTVDEVRDNLHRISEQVDRASRFMNQMRELTRRTAAQAVLLDANAVLSESIEFMKPQFKLARVEVETRPAVGLPKVRADRMRLEQVFLNLLVNARQAMDGSATRRLRATTRLIDGPEREVAIEIADTGKGFSKEDVPLLFRPFYTTKKPGGTGLGLSISVGIVREHGGRIEAEGKPGRGATFTVILPAADGDDESEADGDG